MMRVGGPHRRHWLPMALAALALGLQFSLATPLVRAQDALQVTLFAIVATAAVVKMAVMIWYRIND